MLGFLSTRPIEALVMRLRACFESEVAEEFLEALLRLMSYMFMLLPRYKENIKDFTGRYQFASKDGSIAMAALFDRGKMKVMEGTIEDPHITVIFRDGKALLKYLMAPKQDIIVSILRHDIETEGNLNYLYRFGFLARELQRELSPILPWPQK